MRSNQFIASSLLCLAQFVAASLHSRFRFGLFVFGFPWAAYVENRYRGVSQIIWVGLLSDALVALYVSLIFGFLCERLFVRRRMP